MSFAMGVFLTWISTIVFAMFVAVIVDCNAYISAVFNSVCGLLFYIY